MARLASSDRGCGILSYELVCLTSAIIEPLKLDARRYRAHPQIFRSDSRGDRSKPNLMITDEFTCVKKDDVDIDKADADVEDPLPPPTTEAITFTSIDFFSSLSCIGVGVGVTPRLIQPLSLSSS